MSSSDRYVLVSLPTSIASSGDQEDAFSTLKANISSDYGTTYPFKIPEFKIGTLDALVQQADDLSKLNGLCDAVLAKVGESLRSILDGDESKIAQQKKISDKPVEQYLRTFSWNKVKYRADKSLSEIIDSLQKEINGIDNDVKSKYNQYNSIKTNLNALQRKQTGNLSTRSLTPIVDPKLLIQDSEYLETHLVAVPLQLSKDFLKSYETVSPMVVPRSSIKITQDDEFILYGVTVFKKFSQEFVHKCREHRWTPRDYKYVEGGKEEEQKEVDKISRDERKVWGECLRLASTGWSEAAMVWAHVLALRVFVETVLRYGLPLEFVCGLIKTTPKAVKRIKQTFDSTYSYLGGNAFGRDKKGRITKDDAATSQEMAAMSHGGDGAEYTAYVYYEFEIN